MKERLTIPLTIPMKTGEFRMQKIESFDDSLTFSLKFKFYAPIKISWEIIESMSNDSLLDFIKRSCVVKIKESL